ncbi:XRE family transcriptional regulator [Pseudomonas sp. 250J]|jgi:transcriptional regulator with XRE-family HTH domain|uniref:Helix-turn-helix domain-containing protein n=1 Tax=Pseudomonas peradeniyensis TaxID=2745488 RepID=A0A923G3P6_9PSED|nr:MULTISPECIES: helix-turn-helix domain-containing protein [Pseudomonas]KNX80527.1 XRE family transcriptional regulator [Pseudomonas sp. 250J]MBV4506503.1 helix-turn-helix domain-containing protein [Pseudomonas peradeniyensis]MCU7236603.1 helix-turn-helix domain-containing protein [Pseudomonas peradeniyensis]MCU7278395.1 helix-turn-helix domain-containing protein [Pseudomonas peradeniyensis]QZA54746.1 helix-turn-helix domain-containing protein [Pseudomonas sp. 2hn]
MTPSLIIERLGEQIRTRRLNRGLTQQALATLSGLTRQKVIAMEKGSLSVAIGAYARALAAVDCELQVVPAVMPTLDEIEGMFE